jgi:hypothetical protein
MDIRMSRPRGSNAWAWIAALAAAGLLVWAASTFVFGDATQRTGMLGVGEDAGWGADRAQVLPMEAEPFEAILPLEPRELGRLVRLRGVAESPVRGDAVWVRAAGNRRILVRFEPAPPPAARARLQMGAPVDVEGYLQRMSRAELQTWLDTLGVFLPRPRPGSKFGDLPDTTFAQIDTLFIRNYYVSVRPWGLEPGSGSASVADPSPARPEEADGEAADPR